MSPAGGPGGGEEPDPDAGEPQPSSPFATAAGEPADTGPADTVDDELEAEAHVVEDLLDTMVAEVQADQTAEDAVAEAVELARRFEAERDEYLDLLRRVQAEFENYKRRVDAQKVEQRAQAAADLVKELLPVLDACEAAAAQGLSDVEPVRAQLVQTLQKHGLSAVGDADVAFDPNIHEAVLHEDGDGATVVVEVLRTGYLWNDRVVRAAMVKVRG